MKFKYILFIIIIVLFNFNSCEKKKIEPKSAKLVFVGDIMTHPNIVKSFENKDILIDLKDYLNGDIVFANLEFVVNTNKPPMPYPEFNGSIEYLRYFFNYFNLFSVANNHAYDQGARAEAQTIAEIERNNKLILGGSTNDNDIKPLITNINDIPIFISAYTMLDNGISYRTNENGYFYFMNFFPKEKDLIEKVKNDLTLATNGELKIISLHFGLEYTTEPEAKTVEIARNLIENGVDIIIGHHPHVPRRSEIYEGKNHKGIIIYSLGNFISSHKGRFPYLDIGTILSLEIKENKEINFEFMSTYYAFFYKNKFNKNDFDFIIKPIKETTEIFMPELKTNYIYSDYDTNAIKNGYKLINQFHSHLTNENVKNLFVENRTN